jgi:hypothetical protein
VLLVPLTLIGVMFSYIVLSVVGSWSYDSGRKDGYRDGVEDGRRNSWIPEQSLPINLQQNGQNTLSANS